MVLLLQREMSDERRTHGDLYIKKPPGEPGNRMWECYSLEDPVRLDNPATSQNEGEKIPERTAIPAGRYRVAMRWSDHFRRMLPGVYEVPGFTDVEIHVGNMEKDTRGCILVGQKRRPDMVLQSTAALDALCPKIQAAQNMGEDIWIEIRNAETL